ncbi:MAG: 30S ribosomal protein S6 [Thermodesulfobacteriota bacterium]
MTLAVNHYETLSILNADLSDEALKGIIGTATSIITEADGVIHKVDEWGRRRLAYPILKKKDGFYFLMTYSTGITAQRELLRRFKLNEDVMRSQTIAIDEAAVEVVKESLVKEAEAKAAVEKEAAEKEAAVKEADAVKEASSLVEDAAKSVPSETKTEEITDPAIKAADDLIGAAAKAAPEPEAKEEAKSESKPEAKEEAKPASGAAGDEEVEGGSDE